MKKNNKKGFTLAELLIVVAIIAVLVAIAIPIFTAQLEKSREATDLANLRSAYAQAAAAALTETDGIGEATTPKMVSSGTFDKVDVSDVSWYTGIGTVSITKGQTATITVNSNTEPATVTVTFGGGAGGGAGGEGGE